MRISDWSSDVCSSDLLDGRAGLQLEHAGHDNLVSRCHALDDPYQLDEGRTQCDGLHRGLVLGIDLPDIRTFRPTGDGPRRHEHRSEEHTSELQSLMRTSYAGFCLYKQIHEDTGECDRTSTPGHNRPRRG